MHIKNKLKINSYEFITTIGEGRYSTVYKANNSDKLVVAIKVVSKNINLCLQKYVENERKVVKYLKPHKNLVKHLDYFENDKAYFFVMDYIDGYTLKREITESIWGENRTEFSFEYKKSIILQTIEAIRFLHDNNIYHCDIKPDNIVLEGDLVKLVDFGCSFYTENKFVTFTKGVINSTPGIGPPEVVFIDPNLSVDMEKVDVWGIGCLIYFIFSGSVPFSSHNSTETFLEVKNLKIKYNYLPKNVANICKAIFINDLKKRLSLNELKELICDLKKDE